MSISLLFLGGEYNPIHPPPFTRFCDHQCMGWPIPVMPYISNLLVDPEARRQGLARLLMARCEEQARSWGFTQVYNFSVVL